MPPRATRPKEFAAAPGTPELSTKLRIEAGLPALPNRYDDEFFADSFTSEADKHGATA